MNPINKELWKSLDYAIFGSSEPEDIQDGMKRLRSQYLEERSSLGRYLVSLRQHDDHSVEDMATQTGIPVERWRRWEADLETPSKEELNEVADCLEWRSRKREITERLRLQAPRHRLKRLIEFHPKLLAARGELERGELAWTSIDEATQKAICKWGDEKGLSFPGELLDFFQKFRGDEQARDSWLDEILGGESGGAEPF